MNAKRSPLILYVLGGPLDVGGAERQLLTLAPALAREGLRVELFCLQRRGTLADAMEAQGVPVHVVPWMAERRPGLLARLGRTLAAVRALRAHVRHLSPDVLHFVLPRGYVVGGLASLLMAGPKRVMSRRGLNRYMAGHPLARGLEAFLHRRMDALVGNSQAVVRELIAEGAPPSRVALIHNGIDLSRFVSGPDRDAIRASLHVPKDALLLVKVANLWSCKGHADLLDALSRVEFGRTWRLLLVGRDEGAERALHEQAARTGLQDKVLFAGPRDDVPALLAVADIGISASHEEGFSNAVLEYLAAGLATVVTDVGGNAEAVGDAGLVVPPRNPQAMAAALEQLADDAVRAASGQRAKERAALFDAASCAHHYQQLYKSLLDCGTLPHALRTEG